MPYTVLLPGTDGSIIIRLRKGQPVISRGRGLETPAFAGDIRSTDSTNAESLSRPHKSPPKPGGEGWLVNGDAQLLVRFRNDNPTAHGQWVILNTYRWVRPHPPVPQRERHMLRNNAVVARKNMQVVGWRKCHPPMR